MITIATSPDNHTANKAYHPKGFAMSNLGYVQHLQRMDRIPAAKPLSYKQWIMLVIRIVKHDAMQGIAQLQAKPFDSVTR